MIREFVAPGRAKPVVKITDPMFPVKLLPWGMEETRLRVETFALVLVFLVNSGLFVIIPLPGLLPKDTIPPVKPNTSLFGVTVGCLGFPG